MMYRINSGEKESHCPSFVACVNIKLEQNGCEEQRDSLRYRYCLFFIICRGASLFQMPDILVLLQAKFEVVHFDFWT